MRRIKALALLVPVLLLVAMGLVAVVQRAHVDTSARASASLAPADYIYYVLKQSQGFVLARAVKGAAGQPVSTPQVIASFSDAFGQVGGDAVLSMQLSPDGKYLAINGTRDHGEQVWVYDTEHMVMRLTPEHVMGNFLHWLPTGDRFLYRPMFPMGPDAPMDGNNGWNPGLWIVNAATGSHLNINIHMPSAFLVDAAPSPDGTRIVYSTSEGLGLGSDTWLMNSNGSNQRHLFHLAGGAQSIAGLFTWSPDGKEIAYERISDSPVPFLPAGLWVMNGVGNVGGKQRFLAQADGGHGYAPLWSPDGTRIAFIERTNLTDRQADNSAQALQCGIAVADVASGRSWLVAEPQQTNMQININPAWSANSASITFTSFVPMNTLIGALPHYWSAEVGSTTMRPAVRSLATPSMRIFAAG
jgi:Tol biopolymer transport system component